MPMITNLDYKSLRFSIFSKQKLKEWEIRIEFNNKAEKYEAYLNRDRAGTGRICEYTYF